MRTAFAVLGALTMTGCVLVQETEGEGGGGSGGTGGTGDQPCDGVPTTGICLDEHTIRGCFVSEDFDTPPQVIETTCQDSEACVMGVNGAECQLIGDCYDGDSQCQDASTLLNCVNAAWVPEDCGSVSCVSQPGLGAQCLSAAGGTGIMLNGHLEYEYLLPNGSLTDFDSTPHAEGAVDFFVTVYHIPQNGDPSEMIGMGLTSPGGNGSNPGDWSIELSQAVNENCFLYFWPMLFDNNGQPRMALAKAQSADAIHQASTEYWSWGFETCAEGTGECGTTDLGTQLITTDMDSGAAHIYQWLDYGIFRFEGLYPGIDPLSYAVFWAPGNDFNCGNCFVPPIGGGANVTYDTQQNLIDHYDTAMNISGSQDSPTMWAKSVINHEFGHWSMASYTKSPGEGGVHYVNAASRPGLSYSEGYATFVGQSQISTSNSDNDPIYFTKKSGTTFWVDISKNTYSGGPLDPPDPNGPIDQYINENVVASMFWSFWASAQAVTPQGLGETPVFDTFRSPRLMGTTDRGYHTVDMIDYLDAMTCESTATGAQISAVASGVGYPWDSSPICP